MMDAIFIFYFELLFALLKHLEISPFYPCVPKIRIRWCMVPEILVQQTDGWTEKWHVEVGALHCFSLKIYGFCSSNALYLESLQSISTRMFDTFDNWDHYYFESNLSLELLIKVFLYKTHVAFFLSLLKKRKKFATWNYFCVHLVFHWSHIVKIFLPKAGGSEKR